jgi:alpha-tubulin suppressor-like RCC1 family protein
MRQVAQVSAGAEHTCVVLKSGEGFCWGMNASNQLGTRNNRTDRFIPRPIRRATLPMLQVAAGGEMTCFFRERVNGVTPIACRGWDRIYFFTSRLRFVQIQAGYGHVCGLRENGRVACMGRNDYGQFGRGVFGPGGLLVGRTIQDLNRITAVSAGWYPSCALRDTGRIFCWGLNAAGQLGDGTRTDSASPIRVAGPLATDAVQITGGAEHSCLLDTQGRVACWGDNDFGQLGDGTTTDRLRPVRVAN